MVTAVLKILPLKFEQQVQTANDTIKMQKRVTHHSLSLQVGLVSNQHHREVISVFHSQDLGVELLDFMVAVSHSISKQRFMWILIYSKESTATWPQMTYLICSSQFDVPKNILLTLCAFISCNVVLAGDLTGFIQSHMSMFTHMQKLQKLLK